MLRSTQHGCFLCTILASLLLCDVRGTTSNIRRIVFSLTTIPKRIRKIKPVLDAIVEGQSRVPDAVYLAVPPSVKKLPSWLSKYNETTKRPGILRVLPMESDYGPASKLLAVLAEGGERSSDTLVVYGDDDVLYSSTIIEQHMEAQQSASQLSAFGSRKISIGEGSSSESLLEATGTISVVASALPEAAFHVREMAPACRLSDDYWVSHHLTHAGVALELLPRCHYDFSLNEWPRSCGFPFRTMPSIERIEALSKTVIDEDGEVERHGGDWRAQLGRYAVCQKLLKAREEL